MKAIKQFRGFSLIELAVVLMVIGILTISLVAGYGIIKRARISSAMSITASSGISSISGLQIWLETTASEFVSNDVKNGDFINMWNGRASPSDFASNSSDSPTFCASCISDLPGIKFSQNSYLVLPSKLSHIFKSDFVLYVVEKSGVNKGYFINVEGASDNSYAIGYESDNTIRFFDKTIPIPHDSSDTKIHMFMIEGGVKYYSMNGSSPMLMALNKPEPSVFRFAQNYYKLFDVNLSKVAAKAGDYILGRSESTISEVIVVSSFGEESIYEKSDTIANYLLKKYRIKRIPYSSTQEDNDADGVIDNQDQCPTQAGQPSNNGCPYGDFDGDGINDNQDQCPTVPGPSSNNGCSYGDLDGDGMTDDIDQCPSVFGSASNNGCPYPDSDGDGVNDNQDACPTQAGHSANNGCPYLDSDGDGINDSQDSCPSVFGPASNNGCPYLDSDGDGVSDNQDSCPTQSGPSANNGCPYTDSDGDGINDNIDQCPSVQGPASNNGCPYPQSQDGDGDGVPNSDDWCSNLAGPVENHGCPCSYASYNSAICPVDNDGDGVYDHLDQCPYNAGPAANNGCPYADSDGDGVPDHIDQCPNQWGYGSNGCLTDNDYDGVPNETDQCPNQWGPVSNSGCPVIDSDGDGVQDHLDQCPYQWGNGSNGCLTDNDWDGVPNEIDQCPNQWGPASNNGCP